MILLVLAIACAPSAPGEGGRGGGGGRHDTAGGDTDPGDDTDVRDTDPDVLPDPCADAVAPDVVVNELVAANLASVTDLDGDTPDWIELANLDAVAVDLGGWELATPDGDWTLPAFTLEPGAFRVVLASGQDRADPAAELHTDFTLPAEAATVELVAPDGCPADRTTSGRLYGDVSWGRTSADPAVYGYFLEPTPGAANLTESRPGFAAPPTLGPDPGWLDGPVKVTLASSEAGATIRYTTNGKAPDETDGVYAAPFGVDAGATPVPVRARAWVDGLWPSRVATGTYYGDPDLPAKGVRMVFLTATPADLFSTETGIYAWGEPDYETGYPYFGANFWEDWEREVHVEMVEPDGTRLIDQDGGISIHGGYTRAFDQKSFTLVARGAYGPDSFDGAFFPNEPDAEYTSLTLEIGMDWCSTHLFDAFSDRLTRDSDGARFPETDVKASAATMVWIDGEPWGFYVLRERLDGDFVAAHHDVDADALDRLELGWTSSPHWDVEQGDTDAFDALNTFVAERDLADPDAWAEFTTLVDVDNLAATTLVEAWFGNTDWWWNNIRMWRPRDDEGRWRWMLYDMGHGWPNVGFDQFAYSLTYTGDGMPIGEALQNETFRTLVANQAADWLNTAWAGDTARARLLDFADEAAGAMPDQMERWCNSDVGAWESAMDVAAEYAGQREARLRGHLLRDLELAGTAELALDVDPAGAGRFRLTAIDVDAPFSGTYFLGVPITITAEAAPGWAFSGWSDEALGTEPTAVVAPDGDLALTARFVASP